MHPPVFSTAQTLPFSPSEQVPFKLALKKKCIFILRLFSMHNFTMNEQYEKPQDSLVIWILKWNFISGLQGSIISHRF